MTLLSIIAFWSLRFRKCLDRLRSVHFKLTEVNLDLKPASEWMDPLVWKLLCLLFCFSECSVCKE